LQTFLVCRNVAEQGHDGEDMTQVIVMVAVAACVVGCDSAPRAYADPERLEWEVVKGDPSVLQVFSSTGNWFVGCPDGVSLMIAGPHRSRGVDGDKIPFSIGRLDLELRRQVEHDLAFYAYGSLNPEALEVIAQGGAVRIGLGRQKIVLPAIKPELASPFSEACQEKRMRLLSDHGA